MMPSLQTYADLAYAKPATIQNTYDLTRRVISENVPYAALVECGVAAGSQIGVMGQACNDAGVYNRLIWGFDSFQGIPLAGPKDDDQPGIGPVDPHRPLPDDPRKLLVSSGITVHSQDTVRANLLRWGRDITQYRLIEGWFQDTLPMTAPMIGRIALLRLDGDLYESTKVCLDYLHRLVIPGGFVIVDDYMLTGARKAVDEYFDANGLTYQPRPVDPACPEAHWYQVTRQPTVLKQFLR